jgi:hypothetical protein
LPWNLKIIIKKTMSCNPFFFFLYHWRWKPPTLSFSLEDKSIDAKTEVISGWNPATKFPISLKVFDDFLYLISRLRDINAKKKRKSLRSKQNIYNRRDKNKIKTKIKRLSRFTHLLNSKQGEKTANYCQFQI